MAKFEPIAHIKCDSHELYEVPSQGSLRSLSAEIVFNSDIDPQALEDLKGIQRIWVIFHFHLAQNWKTKVFPPRGERKISLFATRSPHRPNPIGLSCVELIKVDKRVLKIKGHDLVNGTPVFDIKPYIPYADAFTKSSAGWIDNVDDHRHFEIIWSDKALDQITWLNQNSQWPIKRLAGQILSAGIRPERDRITKINKTDWELACKSWRLSIKQFSEDTILIQNIYTGYSLEDLNSNVDSRWQDMDEHRKFIKFFQNK